MVRSKHVNVGPQPGQRNDAGFFPAALLWPVALHADGEVDILLFPQIHRRFGCLDVPIAAIQMREVRRHARFGEQYRDPRFLPVEQAAQKAGGRQAGGLDPVDGNRRAHRSTPCSAGWDRNPLTGF